MQKVDFLRLEDKVVEIKNLLNIVETCLKVGLVSQLSQEDTEMLKQVANLEVLAELMKQKVEELECLCLTYLEALEAQKSKEVVR